MSRCHRATENKCVPIEKIMNEYYNILKYGTISVSLGKETLAHNLLKNKVWKCENKGSEEVEEKPSREGVV